MAHVAYFLLAVTAAYVGALAGIWLLRSPGRVAGAAAACVTSLLPASPLLIPSEMVIARAFASIFALDAVFRLIDLFRQRRRVGPEIIRRRDVLTFLIPFPVFLAVFLRYQRARRQGNVGSLELHRIVGGAAGLALALLLLFLAAKSETLRNSFFLDHIAKLVLFVLAIESIAQLLCGLERLAGFATEPIVKLAFLSRSPGEFWRRYNNRVHAWLHDNVFLPSGGQRAPLRALCLTLLVSGLFHELMFDIATSHWDGYQLTFFLLQIPGILASGKLEQLAARPGWAGKAVAHGLSALWMGWTSIFFFHGMNRVFPIVYVSDPWLP